ncbi:pulmonary surfactant-associated protein C-like [Varanus komodoensis]|uniref:pulmonary surfactant-associated protein C-like n=1 Tax=Varanus komodoensis TaxID=61221 RepID=UPI001CF7D80F|nr:pulmonary surfactant-associated protein C-like [Varanus komodoensis]
MAERPSVLLFPSQAAVCQPADLSLPLCASAEGDSGDPRGVSQKRRLGLTCPCCPGCCPCCPGCCGCCPGCPGCPGCGSCPGCPGCPGCGSCPGCPGCPGCCPPSCGCCCRMCCSVPRLLCRLPKLACCPVHLRRLLMVVLVIVLVVVVIVGALLMGIFIVQARTEALLQMAFDGPEGGWAQLSFPLEMEEAITFYVEEGARGPATVVYDLNKLLIGYKPSQGDTCYITRMDKENIQGLDAAVKEFQVRSLAGLRGSCGVVLGDTVSTQPPVPSPTQRREKRRGQQEALPSSLVDRATLGATLNILCRRVPILWA